MKLSKEEKEKVMQNYKVHDKDTGSSAVQISLLTKRVNDLTGHFKVHKKDHHSRYGLLKLVSQRRRFLDYLKRQDPNKYSKLIKELGLRK